MRQLQFVFFFHLTAQEKLKMMEKYLPEEEEIENLHDFDGELSQLSEVDQYFLLLSKVPDYKLLIRLGIAKTSFEEKLNEFQPALNDYKQTCHGKHRLSSTAALQNNKLPRFFLFYFTYFVFLHPTLKYSLFLRRYFLLCFSINHIYDICQVIFLYSFSTFFELGLFQRINLFMCVKLALHLPNYTNADHPVGFCLQVVRQAGPLQRVDDYLLVAAHE